MSLTQPEYPSNDYDKEDEPLSVLNLFGPADSDIPFDCPIPKWVWLSGATLIVCAIAVAALSKFVFHLYY